MEISTLMQLLEAEKGILSVSSAQKAGISRSQLSELTNKRVLQRVSKGLYIAADDVCDEMYTLQQSARKIIYSHETALYLHGLTDRAPFMFTATVPSGYKPSSTLKSRCKIRYIQAPLHKLGAISMPSGMGHQILAYDVERTICDIVRNRSGIDIQIFTEALKEYAKSKNKDLRKLHEYAKLFRVQKIIATYLEVLL